MEIISPGKAGKELTRGINRLITQLSDTPQRASSERIHKIIVSENSHLLVAVDQGTVLGMLTIAVYTIPTGIRAVIEDVVVDKDARSRGIGRELLKRAIVRSEAMGADTIHLTSHPSRRAANRLYGQLGFEIRETNAYHYLIKEK